MLNFPDIYLSRRERALLKRLFNGKQALTVKDIEVFDYLSKLEFSEPCFVVQYSGSRDARAEEFTITDFGRRYLLWWRAQRRKEILDWVRYGITTAVAIVALLTAVFLR